MDELSKDFIKVGVAFDSYIIEFIKRRYIATTLKLKNNIDRIKKIKFNAPSLFINLVEDDIIKNAYNIIKNMVENVFSKKNVIAVDFGKFLDYELIISGNNNYFDKIKNHCLEICDNFIKKNHEILFDEYTFFEMVKKQKNNEIDNYINNFIKIQIDCIKGVLSNTYEKAFKEEIKVSFIKNATGEDTILPTERELKIIPDAVGYTQQSNESEYQATLKPEVLFIGECSINGYAITVESNSPEDEELFFNLLRSNGAYDEHGYPVWYKLFDLAKKN